MAWNAIADSLPPKGQDVLLLWTYPEQAEVQYVRLGSSFMEVYCRELGTVPLFKIEVDCGDSGSWFYTSKEDAPTHWHELPALPGEPA
jgi:hypothetical protein